jgi:hypothetical protein
MMRKNRNWQLTLLICSLAIVASDLVVTLKLASDIDTVQLSLQQRTRALPCQAIPTRFALAEPNCTNKLLRAMNVTNINILSLSTFDSRFKNETDLCSEN